jgi:hypothetical protein
MMLKTQEGEVFYGTVGGILVQMGNLSMVLDAVIPVEAITNAAPSPTASEYFNFHIL